MYAYFLLDEIDETHRVRINLAIDFVPMPPLIVPVIDPDDPTI